MTNFKTKYPQVQPPPQSRGHSIKSFFQNTFAGSFCGLGNLVAKRSKKTADATTESFFAKSNIAAANTLSMDEHLSEPQLGAICKGVAIANILNHLAFEQYAKTQPEKQYLIPKIHAIKPEIRAIFNANKVKAPRIQVKSLLKEYHAPRHLSTHPTHSTHSTHHQSQNQMQQKTAAAKTIPEILQDHQYSVQGEILSKRMIVWAIQEAAEQNYEHDLAKRIEAKFVDFKQSKKSTAKNTVKNTEENYDEIYANFKDLIQTALNDQKVVAVFFNMNFPLKLDQQQVQSVNPEKCDEFYEHVAIVRSVFQKDGVDKVVIEHFGRSFIENLDDLCRSNLNLTPRQAESYIKNQDYFNPTIEKALKKQYAVATKEALNQKLSELINSGEIYDFDSKIHYLAYIYTREYFSKTHYETHFEPWLKAFAKSQSLKNGLTLQSNPNQAIVRTTHMPLHLENSNSEDTEPDNSFKGSVLICGLAA